MEHIIEICIHFRIEDAKMCGGVGSVGYARDVIEISVEKEACDLKGFIEKKHAEMASIFKVQAEKVHIIHQKEYEIETREEKKIWEGKHV